MQKNHKHTYKVMFTQTYQGVITWSFLKCDCGKTKEVKGVYEKGSENTWSSNPAKYTK